VKEKGFEWGFVNAYKQNVCYKTRKIKIENKMRHIHKKKVREKYLGFDRNW